jgi:hypothetical protein
MDRNITRTTVPAGPEWFVALLDETRWEVILVPIVAFRPGARTCLLFSEFCGYHRRGPRRLLPKIFFLVKRPPGFLNRHRGPPFSRCQRLSHSAQNVRMFEGSSLPPSLRGMMWPAISLPPNPRSGVRQSG